jgi:hypothetical protein
MLTCSAHIESQKVEKGTPHEWIELLCDLEEIWTRNSINGNTDRMSTIRALVRAESGVTFDTALEAVSKVKILAPGNHWIVRVGCSTSLAILV